MNSADDISALLQRVAKGDRVAFSAVYQATSAKLYGIILRILRRRDLADEVLQEVYVKIWERASDFDARRGSPISWMAAMARNRAIDELRRRSPEPLENHPAILNLASDDPSALARVVQSEDGKRLLHCLDALEPARRQMVLLAYCDGLSRDQIAKHFGQPVNTIKTWLRRSLSQLRGCLNA